MEETSSTPIFKKVDKYIFEQIDRFKQTPNYTPINDFYNGLDEEQQKATKAGIILSLFLFPILVLMLLLWQNNTLRDELNTRIQMVDKAQQIIGQSQGLKAVMPNILSQNPIDGQSMMSSRISNLFSSIGVDLNKLQVTNFNSNAISANVMKSEADFTFSNLSTDELMNIFTGMIQREKFRIESVDILRNSDSNLLQGKFHGIHFSSTQTLGDE
jgi:hypothetical protein